ncbi:GCG_CRPN prefix-to-repeats domain-containing protein [Xanthobacter sp. YC-JY1]|uniref:GCG_CRPN prefix-to-repeats domain-containing protein n=1 Tax=Xanthobacter TaxID=279 RepID=UPI001F1DA75B|nr:hypothetical protein [Xanthobacter sp. YC-JY1]UJX47589.1 hypothetical protein D7006_24810 [Xanthobacter sp. YC-JY1]
MRKQILIAAAAAGLFGLGTGVAAAFPAAQPLDRLATVQTVAGGCGIGWHRGPWGGCRPNYWRPYWGPARYCWWRPGPWGPVRVCR